MTKAFIALALFLALAAPLAWPSPAVDGKVSPGEYGHSISALYGSATIYYDRDGSGGFYFAVAAEASGWVGLGLGSAVMDGSRIFMGYVKDGAPAFSEQLGAGHSHAESPKKDYDAWAVGQASGYTTIEFHIPAGVFPANAKSLDYIVAFTGATDFATYHEDNREGGRIDLQ